MLSYNIARKSANLADSGSLCCDDSPVMGLKPEFSAAGLA